MVERLQSQSTNSGQPHEPCSNPLVVIGAGAWGSTLAKLAQRRGNRVRLWSRRSQESLQVAIADAEVILCAVAMAGVRPTIERLQAIALPEQVILVSATKGLDPQTTRTPSQIWREAFPNQPVVVLSGPNLSKEIEQNLPAATVVASESRVAAEKVQLLFSSETFRVYLNSDPLGTELGGALKNVMAIAAGVCDGLHLGSNAKAALLTRALPEMIRVGTTLGAKVETFYGLSGLGDLLVTCNSPLSRNYQVGQGLAQGKTPEEIVSQIEGTAEGMNTTKVLLDLAQQRSIPVPIAWQVYQLLSGQTTPQAALQALMARELKPEFVQSSLNECL